jgi:hypothetical protein
MEFLEKVTDLKFEVVGTFQNEDVSRVAFALAGHGQKHSWELFQRLNTE